MTCCGSLRLCLSDSVLVLLASLFLCRSTSASAYEHFIVNLEEVQASPRAVFEQWLQHVGKSFTGDTAEFERRLSNWNGNLRHLFEGGASEARLNGLADMSDEEFRQAYLGQRERPLELSSSKKHWPYRYRFVEPLLEVNWVEQGIVGPVKNQHVNGSKCGCCWAFATIAVVECINALATGKVVSLSEQQLLDCDHAGPYHDEGCSGGDFDGGMQYVIEHGITTEAEYAYKAEDGKCDKDRASKAVVNIDAHEDVPPHNETALMQGVSMHPVGVAVCVGDYIQQWRNYTGGVLHLPTNCDDPLDHAMVVVGYGKDAQTQEDYWLLKNGWGDQWGEGGYLKLPRGLPGNGACGLTSQPGYPLKIRPNPKPEIEAGSDWSWNELVGRRAAMLQQR